MKTSNHCDENFPFADSAQASSPFCLAEVAFYPFATEIRKELASVSASFTGTIRRDDAQEGLLDHPLKNLVGRT